MKEGDKQNLIGWTNILQRSPEFIVKYISFKNCRFGNYLFVFNMNMEIITTTYYLLTVYTSALGN